jgi:hypothetical protein
MRSVEDDSPSFCSSHPRSFKEIRRRVRLIKKYVRKEYKVLQQFQLHQHLIQSMTWSPMQVTPTCPLSISAGGITWSCSTAPVDSTLGQQEINHLLNEAQELAQGLKGFLGTASQFEERLKQPQVPRTPT